MDYSFITEQQIQQRYASSPDTIRAVLDSERTVAAVGRIGRKHHLDEERLEMLQQLTALVLLGITDVKDLSSELQEHAHLNLAHAKDVTAELHSEIFDSLRDELKNIPVSAPPKAAPPPPVPEDKGLRIKDERYGEAGAEPIPPAFEEPIAPPTAQRGIPSSEDRPFIIHEEKTAVPSFPSRSVSPTPGFSFPLGFLKKDMKPRGSQPVRAVVQGVSLPSEETPLPIQKTPLRAAPAASAAPPSAKTASSFSSGILGRIVPKKEPGRIVHYSSARTLLTPFDRGADIFGEDKGLRIEDKGNDITTNGAAKPRPKVEGNTVFLK